MKTAYCIDVRETSKCYDFGIKLSILIMIALFKAQD